MATEIIKNLKRKCEKDFYEKTLRLFCGLKLITFWKPVEFMPLAYCKQIPQYFNDNGLRYMHICECELGSVIGETALIEKKARYLLLH